MGMAQRHALNSPIMGKSKNRLTPSGLQRRVWLRGASGRVLEGRVWLRGASCRGVVGRCHKQNGMGRTFSQSKQTLDLTALLWGKAKTGLP